MADAIVSAAAERLIGLMEEQARHHINLVRGSEKKVRSLAADLQNIRNVLDDAENRRFKDKKINYWLSRLEQTSYEMEDILDEWDYALLKFQMEERRSEVVVAPPKEKVCSFIPSSSCSCFKKIAVRHNIGKKILIVKEKLDEILKEKDQYDLVISQPSVDPSPESWRVQSTSIIDLTKVHGRDRDRDLLVTKLIDNGGNQEELGFCILSIVGTGGLGKTTLAQMVYNHSRVVESFDLRIWICVSDPFDLVVIAKGILESIETGSSPNTNNLDVLFKHVQKSISKKKFLLVLDDVWTEDYYKWEPLENSLRCGGLESKILVTSRSERVVKMMGAKESEIFRPGLLSDEVCWSLICRMALSGRSEVEFEDLGKKIAKKCKGLPLAAKTLGSLLRFKGSLEQWNNILNSKIWELEEVEVDMFPHLLLSYTELSPTLKRCFSYCAIYPKDAYINVRHLIKDWKALGYLGSNVGDMELKGRNYFDVLAMRSLFQDFEIFDSKEIQFCKMHDIVHDFAQFLKNRSRVEAKEMKKGTICRVCDPSLVSRVNDYLTFYNRNSFPNLCDCLVRLRVLKLCNCNRISQGMETLIHLRQLNLQEITKLSRDDLKAIFQLYHLQTLELRDCNIEDIPKEIGNLIHLSFLDLSQNRLLKELPAEIGDLIHLMHLSLRENKSLKELPESMCDLQELRTLDNGACDSLCTIPERLLPKLREFPVGIGGIKLELLKKLKHLRGCLTLKIRLDGESDGDLIEVLEDARRTRLDNEIDITILEILFKDDMDKKGSSLWMDVMEALQPHPNLKGLLISHYGGSNVPLWMVSPSNQLRKVDLYNCKYLMSLPLFAKLPCLEELCLWHMESLEIVGCDFLGITKGEGEGEGDSIAFPKLRKLVFCFCNKWKVWEDITVEEAEESLIMPCLTELIIRYNNGLRMLPHRLLHKLSSLKKLDLSGSPMLKQRYGDKEGSDWKSISINNPDLHLVMW